ALERLFAPEFRNRLDAVVDFGTLTPEAVERVVDKFITELDAQLLTRHVTIQLTPGARRWLAERGYDKTFGARPMARLIQTEIKRVLADEMLFGQLRDGGRVEVDAGPDGRGFRDARRERSASWRTARRGSASTSERWWARLRRRATARNCSRAPSRRERSRSGSGRRASRSCWNDGRRWARRRGRSTAWWSGSPRRLRRPERGSASTS